MAKKRGENLEEKQGEKEKMAIDIKKKKNRHGVHAVYVFQCYFAYVFNVENA